MGDPDAKDALALPDTARCRGLVHRLPALARERLTLTVFFVDRDGAVAQDPDPAGADAGTLRPHPTVAPR